MAGETTLIYRNTNGDKMTVASGGEILVESGGTLTISAGATIANAGTTAYTGTQTFDDIVGNDTSLGITGAAAASVSAAGGAVAVAGQTGGATSGVGGAGSLAAGAGGGTGAGGVGSVTGGASGGGATGNGGVGKVVGGAAASTDGTGGAAQVTGGVGTGTGAGGAVTITSGAAGATGVAGAVAIAVGGATAGNGSSVTITGGNGAGGTASGGDVNLVPGAAVSTGAPGEVKVNSDANLCFASYFFTGTPAATDQVFFVAPRAMRVKSIKQVHSVAAGGTSTMTVIKDTSTAAPGAGTSLHQSGTFDLNGTANVVQSATVSTTVATVTMAAGDRLAIKFAHAIQSSAGIVVTVGMVPV